MRGEIKSLWCSCNTFLALLQIQERDNESASLRCSLRTRTASSTQCPHEENLTKVTQPAAKRVQLHHYLLWERKLKLLHESGEVLPLCTLGGQYATVCDCREPAEEDNVIICMNSSDECACMCMSSNLWLSMMCKKLGPRQVGHFIDTHTHTLRTRKHTHFPDWPIFQPCSPWKAAPGVGIILKIGVDFLGGISEWTSLPFTTAVSPRSLKVFTNSFYSFICPYTSNSDS